MSPFFWFFRPRLDEEEDYGELVERELETEDSPKLSKLVMHCERISFTNRERRYTVKQLATLGVTAILLPDVGSLLSGASHFRPCPIPILESHLKISLSDLGVRPGYSLGGSIATQLRVEATSMLEDARKSKGHIKALTGWDELYMQRSNPFWGIVNGFEWSSRPILSEWGGNTQTMKSPHVQIFCCGSNCHREDALEFEELRLIANTAYNRSHQSGFEDETIFPILVFSGFEERRMRVIEAVFDRAGEKLTVKFTPMYSFGKKKEAPWEAFTSLVASTPEQRRGCSC